MASGDTIAVLHPFQNEYPSSDFAALGFRNAHPVLLFTDGNTESSVFSSILPRHYGSSGLTVYLHWSHSVATSGDVDWGVSFERIGNSQQDIDSDGFASAQTKVDDAVPGTSGYVRTTTITFTDGAQIDSIAVGESYRIKVQRTGGTAVGGYAQLCGVEIKET